MSSTAAGWLQFVLLFAALAACYVPLGNYIAHIFTTDKDWRVERGFYRLIGINRSADMKWSTYVRSILAFSAVSVLFLYGMERLQHYLFSFVGPHMANVPQNTAWNTAVSFVTNTNWQNYAGESTMTYIVQMSGLVVQQFLSAAVGLAVAIAMIRGFTRSRTDKLGNFWVDVTRGMVRLLLPLSIVGGLVLVATGAIDNFSAYHTVTTLSGAHQTIPGGPVGSSEIIKNMGNNGGGWFNTNSAHPFENPNAFSDIFEIFTLLLIPFATPRAFGKMVKDNRQGYALVAVMVIIWAAAVGGISFFEAHTGTGGTATMLARHAAEGTETRFGTPGCSLFAVVHHGDVYRRGELLPRFADPVRRRHRAVRHRARRDRARRHRRRHVRPAHPGHRHGLRGRADGRPDPGVHRQEDPAGGDEVRGAVLPHPSGGHPHRGRAVDRHERRAERDLQSGAARPDRDRVRVRLDGQQQRLGVRRPGHGRDLVPDARAAS